MDCYQSAMEITKLLSYIGIGGISLAGYARLLLHNYSTQLSGFDYGYFVVGGLLGYLFFSEKDPKKKDDMFSTIKKGASDMASSVSKTKTRTCLEIKPGTTDQAHTVLRFEPDYSN